MDRSSSIVRVSVVGIAANIVLAAFKAAVGLIAGSIAVVLDAVNNLSDAFSSAVTIIGTKLANRPPDRKHPYGHGRIEYVSSVVLSLIVLLAGVTSIRESVSAILHPEAADYSLVTVIVVAAAVIVKFFLGRFVKKSGERLNSESLVASGTDAFFDAVVSAATLVGAAATLLFHVTVDGWLGLLISILIIRAGAEILMKSLSDIVGQRVEGDLTRSLRNRINSMDGVLGTYDLILHRYGPEKLIGSVHVEVADSLTAREIHRLTRKISEEVYREFGIILTVGIYASNSEDPEAEAIKADVERIAASHPEVLGIHGFYIEPGSRRVSFDLLVDFGRNAKEVYEKVCDEIAAAHPECIFDIVLDSDFSD